MTRRTLHLAALLVSAIAVPASAGVAVEDDSALKTQSAGSRVVAPAPGPAPVASPVGQVRQSDPLSGLHNLVGADPAAKKNAIAQTGVPATAVDNIKGFAKDLPLTVVLGQIVPKGWRGYAKDGSIAELKTVSWSGTNRPWITVLNDVLLENGLLATLDWNRSEIMIERDPLAQVSGPQAAKAVAAAQGTWVLASGRSLRSNMDDWAKKAGWSLAWDPLDLDYQVTNEVRLTGELLGEDGIIANVIKQYADAPRPLGVRFWSGNQVIEIKERVATQPNEGLGSAIQR
jgi:Toxin co-regulated pilus biosynthesis protein Q